MLISFNFIKIAWGSPHFEIFQPYPKVWYYDMHVDFFHVHWLKMVEIGQTSQLLICGCCKFKLSIGLLICNRTCCRSDQVWLVVSSFKYVLPIRADDPSLKKTLFFQVAQPRNHPRGQQMKWMNGVLEVAGSSNRPRGMVPWGAAGFHWSLSPDLHDLSLFHALRYFQDMALDKKKFSWTLILGPGVASSMPMWSRRGGKAPHWHACSIWTLQ